jgi:type IV pilus assembly protein PilC
MRRFTAMFEPLLIIFIGSVVGFVAVALVQAMYGMLGDMNQGM